MTSPSWLGRRHVPGTRVQYRTGYIYVKTREGMVSEARYNWELKHGELGAGDRVFHLDGNRENNHPSNLAKIHFNQTRFVMLRESRVLWTPTIHVRDKKTGRVLVNS